MRPQRREFIVFLNVLFLIVSYDKLYNMRILSLLIADKAFFNEKTNKLTIEGIFDSIKTHKLPAKHSEFFVVVITEGESKEKRHHKIQLKKEEKEIAGFDETVETGKRHTFLARFYDIVFNEPGEYTVEVDVNGERISTNLYLNLIA